MIESLFAELAALEEVEAIALGGSRAGQEYDEKSDYDVYLYIKKPISEETRFTILSKYCSRIEISNHFWELEDNCVLNNGTDLDLLYRSLPDFSREVASVTEQFQAHNGYTTCMGHNLIHSRILYDEEGKLEALQKKHSIPYPPQLKNNIIEQNMKLVRYGLPCFENQILKAAARNDLNSVNHRTAEFMASYFDVLFALNEQTHPGEKRLTALCKKHCRLLPKNFEENIETLFSSLFSDPEQIRQALDRIITELEALLKTQQAAN